jgi:predicted transposase/invertase (TIGR01784 family)
MKAKYINPYTDFGFKKLFGEEASKPQLIDFLNALLPEQNKIVDITFKSTEQFGITKDDRRAVYDIRQLTDGNDARLFGLCFINGRSVS